MISLPIRLRSLQVQGNRFKDLLGMVAQLRLSHVDGAGHFFEDPHMDRMIDSVKGYVRRRLTESSR